jgi:hypothetical protein
MEFDRGICGVMFCIANSDPLVVVYAVTDNFGNMYIIDAQDVLPFVESDKHI